MHRLARKKGGYLLVVDIVSSMKDLPEAAPEDVREAIIVSGKLVESFDKAYGSRRMTAWVAQFRRKPKSKDIGVGLRDLNFQPGAGPTAARTADLLNLMLATLDRKQLFPGEHIGIALVSEAISRVPRGTDPGELAEAVNRMIVEDEARMSRVALGVMSSGWRYLVRGTEGRDDHLITVLAPEEDWPEVQRQGEIPAMAALLSQLNDRYIELG